MTGERAILNSGLWAAYGDALGFTTEMAGESLVQRRIGSKRIERVVSWSRRVGGRFGPQIDLPGGTYSDDTQLRVATSRAIRGDSHFDVETFSKVELPVWLSYELGGGRGTKAATKNLARQDVAWYSNFFKTGGSSYVHAGGNGAAMRIQPHVWASPVHPLSAETKLDIVMNSLCTHGHLRGVGGALFHSACLSFCLSEKHAPGLPQLLDFASSLRHLPKIIAQQDQLAMIWLPTWERAAGVGLADAANQLSAEVAEMLQVAGGHVGASDGEEAYHRLLGALKGREKATRGSGTKTAVLAAVLAWIMRDEGVERALQVAANTLGSDTDTIATMTGAIMGVISADQPETVQDRDYLCQEANRLYLLSQRESTDSFGYPDLLNWRAPSSQVDGVGRLDGALGLAGLGRAEEAGPLFPATSKHNMWWQWLNLDFGQSIVAKRRAEPRALRASQLPVGRVPAGKTPLRKQRKEIMEPVPRRTASGGQQTSLFVDDVQTDPQGRPLVRRYDLDRLTNEAIRSGFEPQLIGKHFLLLSEQPNGLELAVSYAAIVAKARRARQARNKQRESGQRRERTVDDETRRVIEEGARLDLQDRVEALGRVVRQIRQTMTSHGALTSGMTIEQVRDAVRGEARVRANLIWHAVARGLTVAHTPLTGDLASQAKALVRALLEAQAGDLESHLDDAHQLMRRKNEERVSDLIAPALERVNSEIDYALLAAQGEEESPGARAIVNVYQSQGIVQTGARSSANLSIALGSDEKRQLAEALRAARTSLERDPSPESQERSQALLLVDEAELEIETDQPNHLKLRGMLSGIAATVQTLGSAREALEALKAAGALLGLSLH